MAAALICYISYCILDYWSGGEYLGLFCRIIFDHIFFIFLVVFVPLSSCIGVKEEEEEEGIYRFNRCIRWYLYGGERGVW